MRFMAGRNGMDSFNKFIFWICLGLMVANLLAGNTVLYVLSWAALVYYLFRSMSRNVYKRQEENRKYFQIKQAIVKWFKLQRNKLRDRKTHVYRKCPGCKTVLRLPRHKGSHKVRCPRCSAEFEIKV